MPTSTITVKEPSPTSVRVRCAGPSCEKEESQDLRLKRCGGCKAVKFCSAECQKNAWDSHKAECKAMQRGREPTVIPTLYDETHRGRWADGFMVATVGNLPSFIGHLEHHDPSTDGSFSICFAGGKGNLVSKALWESIPEPHRPLLNTRDDDATVAFTFTRSSQKAFGSVIFPLLLTNAKTHQRFRIKLYALVLPDLLMGMFISDSSEFAAGAEWGGREGRVYHFDFGDGKKVDVQGCPLNM